MPTNKELLKLLKGLESELKRLRNEVHHLRNCQKKSRKSAKKSKVENLNKIKPYLVHKKKQELKTEFFKDISSSNKDRLRDIGSVALEIEGISVPEKDVVTELRRRKKKRQRNRRRQSRKKQVSKLVKSGSDLFSAKMQCSSECTQRRLLLRQRMRDAINRRHDHQFTKLFKSYDQLLKFAIGITRQEGGIDNVDFVVSKKHLFDGVDSQNTPLQ